MDLHQGQNLINELFARISHRITTATAQFGALTGVHSVGLLDVVSTTPARPSVANASHHTTLSSLATQLCEKCGPDADAHAAFIATALLAIATLFILQRLRHSLDARLSALLHLGVLMIAGGLVLQAAHGFDHPAAGAPQAPAIQATIQVVTPPSPTERPPVKTKSHSDNARPESGPASQLASTTLQTSNKPAETPARQPTPPTSVSVPPTDSPGDGEAGKLYCDIVLATAAGNVSASHGAQPTNWHSRRLSRYDHLFKKYTRKYFGDNADWRWFKVQAFVESGMRPNAISRSGAIGLMQILPATFRQIQKMNRRFRGKSLWNPEWNIAAGIYYNHFLLTQWSDRAAPRKRLQLMFASYNAGINRVARSIPSSELKQDEALTKYPRLPRETRRYLEKLSYHMTQLRGVAFLHPDGICRRLLPFEPLQKTSYI